MGLPTVETCCFVFDLKTGNIIMGCLNATMTFAVLISLIVAAATAGVRESALTGIEDIDIEEKAGATGFYVMCIILVLMFLVKFLFDVAFVFGVVVGRIGIIKSYLIMWIVFILLSMFTFFIDVARFNAATITLQLFYLGLNIYAILLSYSYYKQLNTREEIYGD